MRGGIIIKFVFFASACAANLAVLCGFAESMMKFKSSASRKIWSIKSQTVSSVNVSYLKFTFGSIS